MRVWPYIIVVTAEGGSHMVMYHVRQSARLEFLRKLAYDIPSTGLRGEHECLFDMGAGGMCILQFAWPKCWANVDSDSRTYVISNRLSWSDRIRIRREINVLYGFDSLLRHSVITPVHAYRGPEVHNRPRFVG
ncbi:MAG: hypothetical protein FWD69_15230 [Polyangiaceae bacterium]|nr:hypothetical protein [Polyangiaceae bacterium]